MPIHSIICDQEKIRISTAVGRSVEVRYSELSGTRLEQEAMLIGMLQALLDFRQRRAQLPRDDPDRDIDPGRPDLFWDGQFLVSRPVTVVAARWSDDGQRFEVELVATKDMEA